MKKLLTMIFGWISSIPKDKILHFTAGLVMYFVCVVVLSFLNNPTTTRLVALIITSLAAVLKEIWVDKKLIGGTPELLDAITTIAGASVGYLFIYFLL